MKPVILFLFIGIIGFAAAKSPFDELFKQLQTIEKNGGKVKIYTNFGTPSVDNSLNNFLGGIKNIGFEDTEETDSESDSDEDDAEDSNEDESEEGDDEDLSDEESSDPADQDGTVEKFLKKLGMIFV